MQAHRFHPLMIILDSWPCTSGRSYLNSWATLWSSFHLLKLWLPRHSTAARSFGLPELGTCPRWYACMLPHGWYLCQLSIHLCRLDRLLVLRSSRTTCARLKWSCSIALPSGISWQRSTTWTSARLSVARLWDLCQYLWSEGPWESALRIGEVAATGGATKPGSCHFSK